MDSLLKYGLTVIVLSLLMSYFYEVVFLFGIFFGFIDAGFSLFLCLGADLSVVRGASKIISLEILFFLVYFLYSRFFK